MFARRTKHLMAAIRNTTPLWWNRAWVIQEASCARNITVLWGPCSMSWYWFESLLLGIRDDCAYENEASKDVSFNAANAITSIRRMRKGHLRSQESAATSMWLARYTEARDPHDKVYSLLALMPQSATELITPDYSESIIETFAKATYAAVVSDGKLDILGWVKLRGDSLTNLDQRPKRNSNLPSWALDLTDVDYSLFDTPVGVFLLNVWDNARTSSKNARYLNDGKLSLTGRSLDYISSTIPAQETRQPGEEEQALLCEFLGQATLLAIKHSPSALFMLSGKEKKTIQLQTTWKDWYIAKLAEKLERERLDCDYLGEGLLLWEQSAGFDKTTVRRDGFSGKYDWYHHLKRYGNFMSGPANLFMTDCGMPGVAPGGIGKGDCVVLLDGARLPVVLSPIADGGDWTFQGFVYVHGCMETGRNGHFWSLRQLHECERTRKRRFIIR